MSEGIEQGEVLGGAEPPAGDGPAVRLRMPWPVRVVAALAWTYVVSVVAWAAYLVVRSRFDRHFAASIDSPINVFYLVVYMFQLDAVRAGSPWRTCWSIRVQAAGNLDHRRKSA